MRSGIFSSVILVGLLFYVFVPASVGAESQQGEFLPFQPNEFLEVSSMSPHARVEDLKVKAGEDSFLGKILARGEVNIKNLSNQKLQISVYLVLFDQHKNLVVAGNYSTISEFGGYEPRHTSTETIFLGYVDDLSRVKYYQYRVVTFLEPIVPE